MDNTVATFGEYEIHSGNGFTVKHHGLAIARFTNLIEAAKYAIRKEA